MMKVLPFVGFSLVVRPVMVPSSTLQNAGLPSQFFRVFPSKSDSHLSSAALAVDEFTTGSTTAAVITDSKAIRRVRSIEFSSLFSEGVFSGEGTVIEDTTVRQDFQARHVRERAIPETMDRPVSASDRLLSRPEYLSEVVSPESFPDSVSRYLKCQIGRSGLSLIRQIATD